MGRRPAGDGPSLSDRRTPWGPATANRSLADRNLEAVACIPSYWDYKR